MKLLARIHYLILNWYAYSWFTAKKRASITTLLQSLQYIHHYGPHSHVAGICAAVSHLHPGEHFSVMSSTRVHEFLSLAAHWPHHSGDRIYPVPTPKPGLLHPCQYFMESSRHYMWDRSTEYGASRWELLEFCIAELQKEQ